MSLEHPEGEFQSVGAQAPTGQRPVLVGEWSRRGPVEERSVAVRAGSVPATQPESSHLAQAGTGDLPTKRILNTVGSTLTG